MIQEARPRRARPLAAGLCLVALLAVAVFMLLAGVGSGRTRVSVEVPEAVALYPGDEVRVLGVPVGNILAIEPHPAGARITFEYDSEVKVPADAKAAIVSPSLVSTRYIQLTPAYHGGPILTSGAVIPQSRTATPVEFDELKAELTKLATSLGPQGADNAGALSNLLKATDANLVGQGESINKSLLRLADASRTLDGSSSDLFATVRHLNDLVTALNSNDREVRSFLHELALSSGVLDGSRAELGSALDGLEETVGRVRSFVDDNRSELRQNAVRLEHATSILTGARQRLADLLLVAPGAASNANNTYDPVSGSLTGALADAVVASPAQFLCSTFYSFGGTPDRCASMLKPWADLIKHDHVPVVLNPLQRNGRENQVGGSPSEDAGRALFPGLLKGTGGG